MSNKFKLLWIVCSGLVVSPAAMAVDLVGVHDLALKSDPRLQAAEYRREATAENKTQAWANLLPQLSANGNWSKGNSKISLAGSEITDDTTETQSYGLTLQQSLYRQANYEQLDVARGQISQAEAIYQIAFLDFLLRVSDRYFLVLTQIDGITFAEAEELALKRQYEQAEQRFEVGPDLSLHDDEKDWLNPIEESFYSPPEVEWDIDMKHLFPEQAVDTIRARGCEGRQAQGQLWKILRQRFYQGAGSIYLPNRYCVYNDAACFIGWIKPSEPLRPAFQPVPVVQATDRQQQQHQWSDQVDEKGVQPAH